jgi:hypothetical protein
LLKDYIIQYKGLLIIVNEYLTRLVFEIVPPSKIEEMRARIAEVLSKTPNSVRKLEEQTHQLYRSHNYLKLKEVVSDVENLLLLFRPENKFALCRYWEELEKNNFDPVLEYNKAVEGFLMHYHPSSENLFLIIVQVSRFLKEFADFETYNTLSYRHPNIRGNTRELAEIRIFDELKALHICDEEEQETAIEDVETRVKKLTELLRQGKKVPDLKNTGALRRYRRPEATSFIESNIEIRSNRDKFREHYVLQIKEMMRDDVDRHKMDRDLTEVASLEELISENMQFVEHTTINYYYKRWIWMQFPWVCMSLRCDFSERMRRCSTSPTEYMSVSEENTLTLEALKIALYAKVKNQNILNQKIISKKELLGFADRTAKEHAPAFFRPKATAPNPHKTALYNPRDYLKLDKLFKEKSAYPIKPRSIIRPQESTVISFYLTEVKREDHAKTQSLLPSINKTTVPNFTKALAVDRDRDLHQIEQHNEALKRCYNDLRAENDQLSKKLNKLKIMEYNELNERKQIKEIKEVKDRIHEGEAQIERITRELAFSLVEQERLMILIKVCKDNVASN